MKRLLMQFSPSFLSLPVAALPVLKARDFEFVGGVYYGNNRFHDWLVNQPECAGRPILHPDLEELEWAARPLDRAELERIRDRYGDDVLHKIIIGERHVGFGYVNGAMITETQLTRVIEQGGNEAVWQYVISLVQTIEKFLDRTRPDLVFQYAVAGAVALAVHIVAKERGIATFSFIHTRIENELLIATPQGLDDHGQAILQMVEDGDERSIQRAREHIHAFREKPRQPEYSSFTAQKLRRQRSLRGMARGFAKMAYGMVSTKYDTPHSSRFFNGLNEFRAPLRNRSEERVLRRLSSSFEGFANRPYAFYPLHVDPEASTMVISPHHTDQAHVIQRIAQSLPVGMPLLVKEHLPMVGRRPRGFYERLYRMPGVSLLTADSEPHQLVRNASLVVSITGTACLEAVILGRPALLFGRPYFSHMEQGITRLEDHASLREAVVSALESSPAPDDHLERFLGGILANSTSIPSDMLWSTRAQGDPESMRPTAERFADLLARSCKRALMDLPSSSGIGENANS